MMSSLRALPDRVPLRVTLVSSVLLLVTVALGASGAAGTYALRGYLVERVDAQLKQATNLLVSLYDNYGEERDNYLDNYLDVPVGWPSLAVAYSSAGGSISGYYFTEDASRQGPPKLSNIDIDKARRLEGKPFDASTSTGRGHNWRVLVTPLSDGGGSAIAAISLDEVDDTVSKLAFAHVVIGAIVLAILAIVGYAMVRTSLRRLVQAERTAREIAAGDLSRRVPAGHPDTEVGALAAAFNAMLGEIELAFRARERSETEARASEARMRRFAADASHELRTPLTAIRGFAELYRQGGGDPAHVIGRIEHHATRMSALVEDLLLLARLDQRRPVEQRPVDVLELAADAVADTAATADGHPVRLIADADRPPVVIGDELQLRQVIGNLLGNAVQHTPAGTQVTITVATVGGPVDGSVDGSVRAVPPAGPNGGPPAGQVVLSVEDAGPGLTPDDAARVFERFFRTDPSRSRSGAGTGGGHSGSGLGLSIVHALVSAHGGTIRLATAPGSGARFEVRLPLYAPVPELSTQPEAS